MADITVQNLTKYYGDRLILKDISFDIQPGEKVAILGANGAGKTTLLNILTGRLSYDGGHVAFGQGRTAGVIDQMPDFPPESTVEDILRLAFKESDEVAAAMDALTDEMTRKPDDASLLKRYAQLETRLEILGGYNRDYEINRVCNGLEIAQEMRSQKFDLLSGGEKTRINLARIILEQTDVLLLDEPTAQLDPIAARNFLHALFRVNRELGCTVVVATHEPELMADYATCAFELVDGAVRPVEDLGCFKCEAALAERGALCDENAPVAVSARGAWFRYGSDDDWVLRGLDLEVRQGEVHALVGGNGCGKSTLLALIAGTRRAQRGEVRSAISAKAMLPQDPKALFAEERVDEELMEWAHIGGYSADEVQAMMGELGLADRAGLHPYDLSGGQRQMLALGKLLLVHPRLLLLDEPTKGLDRAAREHVAGMIEAARRDGVTVIVSTHDLAFVRRVADRVSLMFDGELACTEPVGEFFRNNLFYRP